MLTHSPSLTKPQVRALAAQIRRFADRLYYSTVLPGLAGEAGELTPNAMEQLEALSHAVKIDYCLATALDDFPLSEKALLTGQEFSGMVDEAIRVIYERDVLPHLATGEKDLVRLAESAHARIREIFEMQFAGMAGQLARV